MMSVSRQDLLILKILKSPFCWQDYGLLSMKRIDLKKKLEDVKQYIVVFSEPKDQEKAADELKS